MINNSNELVSVIIPVYNVEKYVGKCIDSVLRQTYINLQIFLIDDGSTDHSGQICEEYAEKDNRIICHHKENGGLSDARNFALDRAKGKYITFIDSDDYVSEQYVERLYRNLVKAEADISVGNFRRVRENEEILKEINEKSEIRTFNQADAMCALYNDNFKYQFTIACGKLYKAAIFDNIRYPKGRNYEDTSIAHLIYSSALKVVYEDIKLYFYLVRGSSITKSELFMNDDAILAVKDRMDFFERNGYGELLAKSREQYLITLMGVYARIYSDRVNVSQRKVSIYNQVKQGYKNYKSDLHGWKLKGRIILFIVAPGIYSRLLVRLKN